MRRVKQSLILMVILLSQISLSAQTGSLYNIYVGTFTSEGAEGIYLLSFDSSTGELSLKESFKGMEDPSFLRVSPDKSTLYVATRRRGAFGFAEAYKISEQGSLSFINRQSAHGNGPCYIDVSPNGKYVSASTYGSGTVTLYNTDINGGLKEAASIIQNEGSGPDKKRQSGPRAHSVRFTSNGKQAFCADLGSDKVWQYSIKNGELIPSTQKSLDLHPGFGPRHLEFSNRDRSIYVINELKPFVTLFKKQGGEWKEIQNIKTVPDDFSGDNSCADIHTSPDGRYLYGSNRGHNSIVVFRINKRTSQLTYITTVSSEGDWPRNFAISPDGKYMLVANQRSNNIAIFRINSDQGIPEYTGKSLSLPSPVCLEFF